MSLSQQENIIYGTSNKNDGNMSFVYGKKEGVIKNRKDFLSKFGLDLKNCAVIQIEHKDKITVIDKNYRKKIVSEENITIPTEALITKEKGLTLFLITADCLPVALYDTKNEVIALAHLGWKPTGKRLLEKVVKSMQKNFGSDTRDILVEIEPSIKKESYKIINPEQKESPEWLPFLEYLQSGETAVDLVGFNKKQLLDSGILRENIIINDTDTVISEDFFSHYRSVRTGEPEGRFATIIRLK